jgi:hypothetical protein
LPHRSRRKKSRQAYPLRVLGVAQDPSWSQIGVWQERIPFDGFELHETIKSQVVCLMGFFAHPFPLFFFFQCNKPFKRSSNNVNSVFP